MESHLISQINSKPTHIKITNPKIMIISLYLLYEYDKYFKFQIFIAEKEQIFSFCLFPLSKKAGEPSEHSKQ